MPELPKVPAPGVIETYDVSDALGTIRLDSGETLRFGRSACSFDPSAGERVVVTAVQPGPLGRIRATHVDASGPHELTESERIMIISSVLLRPIETCSDWYLAALIADPSERRQRAAAIFRDELEHRRGVPAGVVDEMIEHMRWAKAFEASRGADVKLVIGDPDDVLEMIDEAERTGRITPDEAQRRRDRVRQL